MEEETSSYTRGVNLTHSEGYKGRTELANFGGKFLLVGMDGTCEGCGEEKFVHFFNGSWLCPICVIETLREEAEDFDVHICRIREGEDGIIHETEIAF